MRGLTLLCLVGFILAASLSEGGTLPLAKKAIKWPEGSQFPMEGEFNTTNTTNTSTVQQERQNNISAVWVGTREPIDNDDGFPPLPDGDNTQLSEGGTVPLAKKAIKTTPPPFSIWSPLKSGDEFPTEPHTGNVNQGKQT
ncbi:uncharacterized protein LOC117264492 isoform X1 [Epinephelus lanceolatus]